MTINLKTGQLLQVSRRGFMGGSAAFALAAGLPLKAAKAQEAAAMAAGTNVPAFLTINTDGTVNFLSPFNEGGQGIFTTMAQIVGEELDVDPANFIVDNAPPGADYMVMFGGTGRITGGSFSTRSSYDILRKLGASARSMILQAAAAEWGVPVEELTTEPGVVLHAASGKQAGYGEFAEAAAKLEIPLDVAVKDPADFRWIKQPVKRLDTRDKATGRAKYAIDQQVEGMLRAAVVHAPRRGQTVGAINNQAEIEAMPGVHSVHILDGAVAVTADLWYRARQAVLKADVTWAEPTEDSPRNIPADFSTAALAAAMAANRGESVPATENGDIDAVFAAAAKTVEGEFFAPFVVHGQLEVPSATARFNEDGTLDVWVPNQAPEQYQAAIATLAGLEPAQVNLHSPMMGGFFGRHFLYGSAEVFPEAIQLAKETGRPVKVIWTREEEFLQDAYRPMGYARLAAALDETGMPKGMKIEVIGEAASYRVGGSRTPEKADNGAVEGLDGKTYAYDAVSVRQIRQDVTLAIGYWRSVGHSMNDFMYESFLDDVAVAGGQDPFALRKALLADSPRHIALLDKLEEMSGGWKRGPYEAEDGTTRARGVAMTTAFGSEVGVIAEVSVKDGAARVHHVWVAFDPGQMVNPMLIQQQVEGGVAIGLSEALLEEIVWENGALVQRNYHNYKILDRSMMPKVDVAIIESGAPMGGVGEPGVPAVPPAVRNALLALTGKAINAMPFKNFDLA